MVSIIAAKRYAKSLLELSLEQGKLEEVYADMNLIKEVMAENRELRLLMASPVIDHDKKLAVMNGVFAEKVTELTKQSFKVLAKKQREEILAETAYQFGVLYKQHHNISEATVVTAEPLSEANEAKLKQLMQQELGLQNIELTKQTDAEVLGGFALKFNHKMIDETVRGRLNRLKNSIHKNLTA